MLFRAPGSLYYRLFPLLRNSDSVIIFLWDLKLFLKPFFSFFLYTLYPGLPLGPQGTVQFGIYPVEPDIVRSWAFFSHSSSLWTYKLPKAS